MTTDNCNTNNGTFSVGGVTFRAVPLTGAKRALFWDSNQNCTSAHYTTGTAQAAVAVTSSDAETRPANTRVVWMMRVR